MKTWKKYSTLVCCILCVLLGEFVCFGEASGEAQGTSHHRLYNYMARYMVTFY